MPVSRCSIIIAIVAAIAALVTFALLSPWTLPALRGWVNWLIVESGAWVLLPQEGLFTSYTYNPQTQAPSAHILWERPEETVQAYLQQTPYLPREDANFIGWAPRGKAEGLSWTLPPRLRITWRDRHPSVAWYSLRYLTDGRHDPAPLARVMRVRPRWVSVWTANVNRLKEFPFDTHLNVRAVVVAEVEYEGGERRTVAFVLAPGQGEYFVIGPPANLRGWHLIGMGVNPIRLIPNSL